jgi:hypothetical protein
MKTLIAWLTRNQRCACGGFKLSKATTCFDCSLPPGELAEPMPGRHAA